MTEAYYKEYKGVKLSPRMEEVLVKLHRTGDMCTGYGHFLPTIKALERRSLVVHDPLPRYSEGYNPYKVTMLGLSIVLEVLNN